MNFIYWMYFLKKYIKLILILLHSIFGKNMKKLFLILLIQFTINSFNLEMSDRLIKFDSPVFCIEIKKDEPCSSLYTWSLIENLFKDFKLELDKSSDKLICIANLIHNLDQIIKNNNLDSIAINFIDLA